MASEKNIQSRIQHKHDIELNWEKATGFIPKAGEIIVYDPDENFSHSRIKIGNGTTSINNLKFIDDSNATKDYVESLYIKLNSNTTLGFYCVEDVTIVTNGISKVYPANSNVTVKFIEDDEWEIIPTSNNSILALNAFPGALGTFYPWLEGVKQFSNILFDMNNEAMYTKWNQGNQGAYQVQYAQYTNCIFWSDNPYISEISKRTNYTLYYSSQLPLCYSTNPDYTFKSFYLAFNVNNDPNWGNPVYRESFAKAGWATQVFSYYGARTIGIFDHDNSAFNITLPDDCRGLMYAATAVENAGVFDALNTTTFGARSGSWRDAFGQCRSLKNLYIKNLMVDLDISWSPINYESIYFIISQTAATKPITIFVSPYTYNLLGPSDFELAISKNITIALLTTNYVEDRRLGEIANKVNKDEIVQSDWNENDETSNAFIQNRTHWAEDEKITAFLQTIRGFNDDINGIAYESIDYEGSPPSSANDKYIVIFDGKQYICSPFWYRGEWNLGNANIRAQVDNEPLENMLDGQDLINGNNDYPFEITTWYINNDDGSPDWGNNEVTDVSYYDWEIYTYYEGPDVPHSIQLQYYSDNIIYHQLDERYIPDTIARITDIPEVPEEVNPDWSENNENSTNYIAGRTHWIEKETESITGPFSGNIPSFTFDYEFESEIGNDPYLEHIQEEKKYIVIYDNQQKYELIGYSYTDAWATAYTCLGDSRLNTNYPVKDENNEWIFNDDGSALTTIDNRYPSNAPFFIEYRNESDGFGMSQALHYYYTIYADEQEHTIEILRYTDNEIYHPLNENFIPETIARTSDTKQKDLIITYAPGSTMYTTHSVDEVNQAVSEGRSVYFQKDAELFDLLEVTKDYATFLVCYVNMNGKLQQKVVAMSGNSIMLEQDDIYNYATVDQLNNTLRKTAQTLTDSELTQVRSNLKFIGKNLEGQTFTIDGTEVTAAASSEIFGDYENNIATGQWSIAEGSGTVAKGRASHAEGAYSKALNDGCHVEGYQTEATGYWSHAEGEMTKVTSYASHAEGSYCTLPDGTKRYGTAAGYASHIEGGGCHATGSCSHAEGLATTVSGAQSHAEGRYTIAAGGSQHVEGIANIEDTEGAYIHIAGNGAFDARSNAHTLDWDGNAWFAGDVYVGSTSGINRDEGSKKLLVEDDILITIEDIDAICGATIYAATLNSGTF